MGCWGITAFESDAGLDSVDYIRSNLPKGGKLDLGEIIDALQNDQIRLPDVEFAENHTSPMALAEIVVKFLDGDMDGLDYDEDWAKEQNKFRDITSFTASKESVEWIRVYLTDTLQNKRKQAAFRAKHGQNWCGWFEEKNWIGWQEHMESLIGRLDTLLASPEDRIELISPQGQENGPVMG